MRHASVSVRRAFARLARDPARATARIHVLRDDLTRHLLGGVAGWTARRSHSAAEPDAPLGPIGRRRRAHERAILATEAQTPLHRRFLTLGTDRRGAPVLVLALLFVASLAGVVPGSADATGNTGPVAAAPVARIRALVGNDVEADRPRDIALDAAAAATSDESEARDGLVGRGASPPPVSADGPFASDGTLIKPLTVDGSVPTVADRVRHHTVAAGETLTAVAHRYGISAMTIYWANDLAGLDAPVGTELVVPPTDGLLYTVKEGDTLAGIASAFALEPKVIVEENELEGDVVVLGQELMLPGAKGAPLPPKPTPSPSPVAPRAPVARQPQSGGSSDASGCSGCSFSGSLRWPVAGGYISQYFHPGHYAIDIAADPGTAVFAADGGKVIFAGWKNNGGGYQVHISHGGNMFTTYNHMMSVSVGAGASVARGQKIGRVGSTGYATGPHLHFDVWIGPIWKGGRRVNPMNYL